MTKARARERAKARKGKKRQAAPETSDQQPVAEKFAPGANSVQGPKMDANTKNFAAASRGSARSK
jgi:hypothetical protein